MIDDQTIHQLFCSYEPNYVEIRGSRAGLQAFVKVVLIVETTQRIRLATAKPSEFFKNRILEIEIACTEGAVKVNADGELLHLSGGRGSLAMFAYSIRNLASSEKSASGSHMHFEPGGDECMANDSWSVVVELS